MTQVGEPELKRSRMSRAFGLLPRIAAILMMVLALGVLVGWALEIRAITETTPGEYQMQPMTALTFLLAGLALLLGGEEQPSRRDVILSVVLALVVAVLAGTSGLEYALNRSLGIDLALFHDEVIRSGSIPPGRMAANTTIAFLFGDRKSTRLNSSHEWISYAVFCL